MTIPKHNMQSLRVHVLALMWLHHPPLSYDIVSFAPYKLTNGKTVLDRLGRRDSSSKDPRRHFTTRPPSDYRPFIFRITPDGLKPHLSSFQLGKHIKMPLKSISDLRRTNALKQYPHWSGARPFAICICRTSNFACWTEIAPEK